MDILVKNIDSLNELWKLTDKNTVKLLQALKKGPLSGNEAASLIPNASFYLNELIRLGLVEKVNDKYVLRKRGIAISFEDEAREVSRSNGLYKIFETFTSGDKFEGLIVVGSNEPHGAFNAIAKDLHYVSYLTYYIGKQFEFSRFPIVFDADVLSKNLFNKPLIVIGGPVTNLVTNDLNKFLPIRFTKGREGWELVKGSKSFSRPEHGLIAKIASPFNKKIDIIVLAGVRYVGTFSAIVGLIKRADELSKEQHFAHVVRGIDVNEDGVPEDAELIE